MILVPELKTVVILVPRTGSGSLRRAIAAKYPKAMQLYRHMEADGVPHGYDRWPKVGVVRHPIDRLWSLYKFCREMGGPHDPAYIREIRASIDGRSFSDWLVFNNTVFSHPYDVGGRVDVFIPGYTCRHPMPETRKSQFIHLRPDLGTEIIQFKDLCRLESRLNITLPRYNETVSEPLPKLTAAAAEHLTRFFAWDFDASA